ncbi:MAG: nucleotidyl transferase AbiEii/AbiGii toxin family protein [Acidobacteria bacterium]|nr:nucleotidyl transferase AbiEii/AbiGii toxin family protein [Acidobacteriota bacterium]
MTAPYSPSQVIPRDLAAAVDALTYWFVIGGQAVRCFAPYRPSRDVDFGIDNPENLDDLVSQLGRRGDVEIQERSIDTVHLLWNDTKVSAFVVPHLVRHVEDRHLDMTGILATKLHVILDRGLRRDFFDLYVMLQQHRLGIASALGAMRTVYPGQIDEGLLLRALTYFDDADREATVPGEGKSDWRIIKDYLLAQVGCLLTPPMRRLSIQAQTADVWRD